MRHQPVTGGIREIASGEMQGPTMVKRRIPGVERDRDRMTCIDLRFQPRIDLRTMRHTVVILNITQVTSRYELHAAVFFPDR